MNKTYARKITLEEAEWLRDRGLYIIRIWINPSEGYDYDLYYMGDVHAKYYAKSPRACYSFAQKNKDKFPPGRGLQLVAV